MRAELPWNVAGIPPEAREAARAAARREGLSVGEWLTRRILQSFSGLEEDAAGALDSWGLPASDTSRRDSEEMLARVGRSGTESNDAWRRIEEQLRGLGHRLDSSERTHSESNRVLSRTAQEINVSAREQAHALEQLGHNIAGLSERLERLEREGVQEGLKEAVRALHLGLSRLAEQINSTASNSTTQLAQVTANLEKLAGHVGQIWQDTENSAQLLERRIDVSEQGLTQRITNAERAIEARLAAVEKLAQFNGNALDHALEKIEASDDQRVSDLAESQRRATQQEEGTGRLQDSIARIESLLPGPELEKRLGGVERSIQELTDHFERGDPGERFDTAMQALSHRLEKIETDASATQLLQAPLQAITERLEKLEKDHAALLAERRHAEAPEPAVPPVSAFDAPPFAKQMPAHEPFELPPHQPPAYEPPPLTPDEETDARPPAFDFDAPQAETFTPDFDEVFEEAPPQEPTFEERAFDDAEPENFLTQARRSARAASEKAESEDRSRLSAFRWNQSDFGEEKEKPRYLIPILVALLVLAAAAAALVLSQRARMAPPPASDAVGNIPAPTSPAQFAVPAQVDGQTSASTGNAQDFSSQRSEPAASDVTAATQASASQAPSASAPAPQSPSPPKLASAPAKPAAAPTAADRVITLANAGNPTALTILGLRAADGTNGVAVNLPDAIKFLTQAAEKGQAVAQYRLGTLYERGQGVAVDGVKAVHWYGLAAAQGNRKAMHNLAVAYASGIGGTKNMPEAARWFAKAASLGLSDSQFNLAVLYERGDGVPQSLMDAYKWYSIAAATGDGESKARMGVLQTQLSEADKAAANRSVGSFRAAPLNRAANVPPEPGDLGN